MMSDEERAARLRTHDAFVAIQRAVESLPAEDQITAIVCAAIMLRLDMELFYRLPFTAYVTRMHPSTPPRPRTVEFSVLGQKLRTERVRKGLSLRDVARACKLTDVEIGEVERGTHPTAATYAAVSAFLRSAPLPPSCGVCLDGDAPCPVTDPPGVTVWTCLACGRLVGPNAIEGVDHAR